MEKIAQRIMENAKESGGPWKNPPKREAAISTPTIPDKLAIKQSCKKASLGKVDSAKAQLNENNLKY